MMDDVVEELKKHGVVSERVSAFVDYRSARAFSPSEMLRVDRRIATHVFEFNCAVPHDRRVTSIVFFQPQPDLPQYDLLRMVGCLGFRLTVPIEDRTMWMVMPTAMKRQLVGAVGERAGKARGIVTKNINTKVVSTDGPLIPTQKLGIHHPPKFGHFLEPNLHEPLTPGWLVGVTAQG